MEFENILLNNNISYKIISPYQKVENDKERIKSKFNFNISRTSTNSSILKQSSIPTQKNSIVTHSKKHKIINKLLQQNSKKMNITHHYRPKSININNNKNNNSMNASNISNSKHNNKSKDSEISHKHKNKKNNKDELNNNINNKKKKEKLYTL